MSIFGKIVDGVKNVVTHPKEAAETAWNAAVTTAKENPVVQASTATVGAAAASAGDLKDKAVDAGKWLLDRNFHPIATINSAGGWVNTQIDKIDTKIPVLDQAAGATRATLGFAVDTVTGIASLAALGTPIGQVEAVTAVSTLAAKGELGDAVKGIPAGYIEPVTSAWENGDKTEAITRGALEIGSLFLAGAGLVKAAKVRFVPKPKPPKVEAPKSGVPQPEAPKPEAPKNDVPKAPSQVERLQSLANDELSPVGSSVHPHVPPLDSAGKRVRGVLEVSTNDGGVQIPLKPGEGMPGQWIMDNLPGGPGSGRTRAWTHVEGHAAAVMRKENISKADLFLNKAPCGPTGAAKCRNVLHKLLPPNATLRVHFPDEVTGQTRIWEFTGGVPGHKVIQ